MNSKNVAFPRSPLTGKEIRACLKDRLPDTQEKFSLTSALTTEIERTSFSRLQRPRLSGRLCVLLAPASAKKYLTENTH